MPVTKQESGNFPRVLQSLFIKCQGMNLDLNGQVVWTYFEDAVICAMTSIVKPSLKDTCM
jgi:hypothetical protein